MVWEEIEKRFKEQEPDRELPSKIERPLQAGLVFAPSDVQIDGDKLVWSDQKVRPKRAGSWMLDGFISLCDTEDFPSAVLAYAQKWGVLGICEHGLPCSHNEGTPREPRCLPMLADADRRATGLPPGESVTSANALRLQESGGLRWLGPDRPKDTPPVRFCEPIGTWWNWSRKMKALLGIAAKLNQGEKASSKEWDIVNDVHDNVFGETEEYAKDLRKARLELAAQLNRWISIGQVRPQVSWNRAPAGWRFNLDAVSLGPNLFGVLALYLATEVTGTGKGIAICSSCGNSYRPDRRLDPKKRNYCAKCGKRAAQRDAARDFRRRQRERLR